jgi:hypothetical protein
LDGHDGVLLVSALAVKPENREYGTPPRASIKCIRCAGKCKNQIGAYR